MPCSCVAVLVLVVVFRSSDNPGGSVRLRRHRHHADHVGPAPVPDVACRRQWLGGAHMWWAILGFILVFDLLLFSANALKVEEGGWHAAFCGHRVVFTLMLTWRRGRLLGRAAAARPAAPG